jgi:hypothetical protein
MQYCSPNIHFNDSDHFTCFTTNELLNIAEAFNKAKRHNKLKSIRRIDIENEYSKKELWNEIYKRLQNLCKYEYCWIDLKFIDSIPDKNLRQKIKFFTFKPKMTLNKYSWLSTNDINYVLQQYEKVDNNFKFIGALPSDFYKVISKNQLYDIYNDIYNYVRIGLVFNLDTHDLNGSHWVALYIDNDLKTIEYFDSLGKAPNKYISKFIKMINSKLNKNSNKKYDNKINKIVHQTENSECGVYSIYFIIHRLFGNTFNELTMNVIKDKDMNKFRLNIFRPRK